MLGTDKLRFHFLLMVQPVKPTDGKVHLSSQSLLGVPLGTVPGRTPTCA